MMKTAIIHDWLVTFAGSEQVLAEIIACYPDADVFSVVDFLSDEDRAKLHNKRTTNTFIQHLPFARKKYRAYLPLMPLAIEQIDLSDYELVISSSHAVAKGVITGPDQLHICMCYTPMRYAWDLQHQYLYESGLSKGVKGLLAKWFLHKIRIWDVRTSNGVDEFIAISKYINRRIYKVYRRESKVIYPPVAVNDFPLVEHKEDYYFTASRMVPYKKMDMIVEAFSRMPDKNLVVIGDGPDFHKIKKISKGCSNIDLMGYQTFDVLRDKMSNAKAFVFSAEEDFGIIPVEAQACGTPVIAFGKGGALETIIDGETGVFFDRQDEESLIDAVNRFEIFAEGVSAKRCRLNAENFSSQIFRKSFTGHVEHLLLNGMSGRKDK